MSEMMRMAADRTQESDELKTRVVSLEKELASCKAQLGERRHAIDALIEEFDFFRSSSLAEAQEQLDEMSAVVELQQEQLGESSSPPPPAPGEASTRALRVVAKRLRAAVRCTPGGWGEGGGADGRTQGRTDAADEAVEEERELATIGADPAALQEVDLLISQLRDMAVRRPQAARPHVVRDTEREGSGGKPPAPASPSEARLRRGALESESRALAERVARQRETFERLLQLNGELSVLGSKHKKQGGGGGDFPQATATGRDGTVAMVSPCMTASPIPALGVRASPWVS